MNVTQTRRLDRALDSLWHASSAPQTLMVLVVLLAGTLAFAALIPQQPAGLDSAAAERWLTTTAGSYRGAGPFLRAIDAFRMLSSPWTRALLAALAFNLALRAVAQGRVVRRLWRPADPLPAPSGLPVQHASLPGLFDATLIRAEQMLRAGFSHVTLDHDTARAQLYAINRRPGLLGPLLTYLGGLAILIGLLLNDVAGWQAPEIALAPGSTAALAQEPGLRVTLNAITGESAGAPANVTLTRRAGSRIVAVGAARPARWGNVWVSIQATGPALSVTAEGSDKRPLLLQSLAPGGEVNQTLHVLFQQTQGEQAFAIPTRDLAFRAVSYPALPERGIQRPVFLVEGYRGADSTPAFSELVEDDATLALDGTSLAVRRSYFATLAVAYLPGLIPLLLGCLLMLAGALAVAFVGPVRIWIGMAADGDAVAVALRAAAPAEAEREGARLLQMLRSEPAAAEPDHAS